MTILRKKFSPPVRCQQDFAAPSGRAGTWVITAAADATAVVRFYRKANVALDVEADRQVCLLHTSLGNNPAPQDTAKLVAGFESTLANLGLKDCNDPATTHNARLIIQIAKDGQRDPAALADRATRIVRGSS